MPILYLDGRRIDWRKPPKPTTLVKWHKNTRYNGIIKGSFRTIAHLDRTNERAKRQFGAEVVVLQSAYNTTVSASAGTHDYDACLDTFIPGVDWWVQQKFFRKNGWAAWYRYPPAFGHHMHMISLPPQEGLFLLDDFRMAGMKVGKYVDGGYSIYGRRVTSSQLEDYYNGAQGLSGLHHAGSDRSWSPQKKVNTIFDLKKYTEYNVRLLDAA